MASYAPQLLNAFLLAVVLILLLRQAAAALELVDRPDTRKRHAGPVPIVGGLAMFPAFLVASLLLDDSLRAPWCAIAGLAVLVFIGAIDDRFGLRAAPRLAIQFAAAALMAAPIAETVNPIQDLAPGMMALPLTLVFLVGLANAFNMIDGLDGLAGGIAGCALFWLAMTAMFAGRMNAFVGALPLLFALLGFLVFNLRHRWRPQASVFMGDAGSLLLGGGVAFFIVALAGQGEQVASFATLLWICALPAIETLSLIVRRLWARRSPMAADRRHIHHLLVDGGIAPGRAAAILICVAAVLGAIGFAGARWRADDATMLAGLALVAALHSLFVLIAPTLLPHAAPRVGAEETSAAMERQSA